MTILPAHAGSVLQVVDKGLGMGFESTPVVGQLCVNAAICFALGLPHSDKPTCVGYKVRYFGIALNDMDWRTMPGLSDAPQARARGMRRFAVASLGSDTISQLQFCDRLYVKSLKAMLPVVLRNEMKTQPEFPIEQLCERIAKIVTLDDAKVIAKEIAITYTSMWSSFSYAPGCARAVTSELTPNAKAFLDKFLVCCAEGARLPGVETATFALGAIGTEYEDTMTYFQELLRLLANAAVDVLIEMQSPGVEFLHLCDRPEANTEVLS